jgi:hypothetical protein
MYDQPGSRVPVTNDTGIALPNGAAAYIGGHVGFVEKNQQLDRWTKPGSEEATHVMPDEHCVVFVTDVHEVALVGALQNVAVKDKLYLDATTQTIVTAAGGGAGGTPKNEKQSVKVQGTGGNFKLGWVDPVGHADETADIKFNATAAEVREALEGLDSIDPGDVVVTGGPGNEAGSTPYIVEFAGAYIDTDVNQLTATDTLVGGEEKVTVTTTQAGAGSSDTTFPLGIVDTIDTSRTPHVARVNLSDLKPFIAG